MANLYESGENYLETILLLQRKNGFVRAVDIAGKLGYSKASVSRAMHILKKQELIEIDPGGQIHLTPTGTQKADAIYERHCQITQFLICTLGLPADVADEDACRIEHVISERAFAAICDYVTRESIIQ